MEKDTIATAVNIDNQEKSTMTATGEIKDFRGFLYEMFYKNYGMEDAKVTYNSILAHKKELEKALGKEIGFLVAAMDYSDENSLFLEPRIVEKKLLEQLSEIAIYDSLTGLYKRGVFDSLLKMEIKKHRRYKRPLSLIMLDIDDFKLVNDDHGHQEGDFVLKEIGRIISDNSRLYDIECRYGGEELITILPGTNEEQAFLIAERLRIDIFEYFGDKPYKITVSLGVAELATGDDLVTFVGKVDDALYHAKENGKDQCQIFGGR